MAKIIVMRSIALLFVSLLCSIAPVAAEIPIPSYDIAGDTMNLEDFPIILIEMPVGNSSLERAQAFTASGSPGLSRIIAASPDKSYWAVFALSNSGETTVDRYLRIDEYGAESVNLYYEKEGRIQVDSSGLSVPMASRTVKSPNPSFLLTFPPGVMTVYYLEYHSRFITPSGIHIEDPETYQNIQQRNSRGYLLFFGAALAILVYNGLLALSLKDRTYLYYICFVLTFFIFVLLNSGFSSFFINVPQIHYILSTTVALVFLFLSLFTAEMLQTRNAFPRIHRFLLIMAALFALGAILVLIDIKSAVLIGILGMPSTVILLIIGIYCTGRGNIMARYYVLAISAYLVGVFTIIALNLRVLPYNDFTRYFYLIGSLIEMVTFSLALGFRYKAALEEKLSLQNRLYDAERRNREELEGVVQERTRELTAANRELERMAVIDGLTGLYNRRFFDEKLIAEWNRLQRDGIPISLIMCDIDFFKKLNDSLGHQKGDDCIRQVAKIIMECVKRESDIAARYGGEEFAVILPGTDSNGASEVASCIRDNLRDAAIDHPEAPDRIVTMSFGIATQIPTQPPGSQALVASADKALYKSKKEGRDRISIDK